MSVSVTTTAGTQVSVTVDGASALSFTTEESSVSVTSGDSISVSVTEKGAKGDVGIQGPKGEAGNDGADGANGQGVPTGGTANQVLIKDSGTDYDTSWGAVAYSNVTGTPSLATVATSGAYSDLSGKPSLAAVATSGAYSNLSGTPTIPSGNVVDDTTPQLGGDLDVNGNKIVSASNGDIVIDPDGTGAIILKSDDVRLEGTDTSVEVGTVKLYEADLLGDNFVALKAPLSIASDLTFTLPAADGSDGQVLKTNGSGTLSFTNALDGVNR